MRENFGSGKIRDSELAGSTSGSQMRVPRPTCIQEKSLRLTQVHRSALSDSDTWRIATHRLSIQHVSSSCIHV